MLNGAGDVEDFNGTAVAANEVVLVVALTEAVVGCPTVKTDTADDSLLFKSGYQSIDRRWIARNTEEGTRSNLLERKWLSGFEENLEAGLEGTRFPETGVGALVEKRV